MSYAGGFFYLEFRDIVVYILETNGIIIEIMSGYKRKTKKKPIVGANNAKKSPVNGQPVPSNLNGRPKGVQNKATVEFKEAVTNMISYATPQMVKWLEKIAKKNPEKALEMVYKFAQFGYPLLARTEKTGPGGGPQRHKVTVEFVGEDGNTNS